MGLDAGFDYFKKQPKKTFLICSIRNATESQIKECESVVKTLEDEGYIVHWPYRDTDQNDKTGYNICKTNACAIRKADCVHVVWDDNSAGSHFDLGVAFSYNKKIIPVSLPDYKSGKSFPNMIREWASGV